MTGATGDGATGAVGAAGSGPGGLTITVTTRRVSDTEVAAITVALLVATSGAPSGGPAGAPAWRHAGLLEAATDRRVRTPAELRHPA